MDKICTICEKTEHDCKCGIAHAPSEEVEDVEWVTDETTNGDYIQMAWHVNDFLETYDPMGDKKMEKRKVKLRDMCFDIIEKCIKEVHADLFNAEE